MLSGYKTSNISPKSESGSLHEKQFSMAYINKEIGESI